MSDVEYIIEGDTKKNLMIALSVVVEKIKAEQKKY